MGQIWLRAEYKPLEKRAPLMPVHAQELIQGGHEVVVERCTQRIFPGALYQEAGCELVEPGSWYQAPNHAYILGLKELDALQNPLRHKHIYFAHSFKQQHESQGLLNRFQSGGGILYDLEYLTDSHHQRIASFGFYAGLVGAALALFAWSHQQRYPNQPFKIPNYYSSEMKMLALLKKAMSQIKNKPSISIAGANGRCGLGAQCLFKEFNLEITHWNRDDLPDKNLGEKIFSHDIFLNCIQANSKTPLFFYEKNFKFTFHKKLSLIVDVSCDVSSPYNPIPYYSRATDFDCPIQTISIVDHPIQLIAIDHLPAWLPLESSIHFSNQLFPYLKQLLLSDMPWHQAELEFLKNTKQPEVQPFSKESGYDCTSKSIYCLNR